MKRFHVHLRVYDIDSNVRFYSSLFGAAPAAQDSDSAQWVLEDPPLVLTISAQGNAPGVELLGFHVDSRDELEFLRNRFARADACGIAEPEVNEDQRCDAHWLIDPQGILWQASRRPATEVCILGSSDR
ncbi:MAG: VOC family protein [Betaproteobacteria bacterium]|nr:VOC family protein [Betaproteobacteria bacterium]